MKRQKNLILFVFALLIGLLLACGEKRDDDAIIITPAPPRCEGGC